MLERLRHDAFVGVHDEQQQLHARGAGEHVVQEALVAGHVDDAALDSVVEAQVREPEIERHAALALFDPAIGVRSGERRDERGLPVIDVSRRSDDVHVRVLTDGANAIVRQDFAGGANARLRAALHEALVCRPTCARRQSARAPAALRFVPRNRRALTDEPARITRADIRIGLGVAERRLAVPRGRDAGPDAIELVEEAAHVPLDRAGVGNARVRHRRRVEHCRAGRGEDFDQARRCRSDPANNRARSAPAASSKSARWSVRATDAGRASKRGDRTAGAASCGSRSRGSGSRCPWPNRNPRRSSPARAAR